MEPNESVPGSNGESGPSVSEPGSSFSGSPRDATPGAVPPEVPAPPAPPTSGVDPAAPTGPAPAPPAPLASPAPPLVAASPLAAPAEPETQHFCSSCGVPRVGDGKFCSSCGHPLDEPSAAAPGSPAATHSVAAARPWWRNPAVVIVGAVVVLGLLVLGAVKLAGSKGHTVTGSLALTSLSNVSFSGGTCHGTGGYDDLTGGGQVVIKDGSGASIAVGHLENGVAMSNIGTCMFSFTVTGVPDADIYEVTAGSSKRGGPQYSKSDMEKANWNVELSIGG